jgi:hypothetical protein
MQLRIIFAYFLLVLPAAAADVSLAWDPSASSGVIGYKVYKGNAPRVYQNPIVIGNQSTYTVTGLGTGSWYFAVSAFDAAGNESDFSNEVSRVIGATSIDPPTIATISAIAVPSITTQYATIAWSTSLDCSGTVYYGTAEPLKKAVANNLGTTDHLAVVGPLVSKTHYLFKVESVCNGTVINSGMRSFNTK